jgi:hypothetical protein
VNYRNEELVEIEGARRVKVTCLGEPVAYFVAHTCGSRVACPSCRAATMLHGVPIYRSNIEPYRQSCHLCSRVVVEGRSPAWPELFDDPAAVVARMERARR